MLSRAHTLARLTATLLVALWALQPLGALLHVRDAHAHRYCPQHQAFEETANGKGQGVARLASERSPQLTALPAAGTDAAGLTHETCPVLGSSSRDEASAPNEEPLILEHLAVSRPATAPPSVAAPLPVLATAPKASPPARG
ncbi:hypothetical protein HPC49_46695 [Pyxidicoccus fallax]|uniref:Uncharacterized protein n=1 Tax=Pyxidicoccus fallax TaxID=394095 RepID=A0A848LMZ8_9BACT|nr:hypothetical protein [Pyxidicoccus fallax]NMO18993.1 hypothetical protein [Pyxidicoccus fallax]NPC85666.1 hypothetical protein [Pyxidicoccus fallax]